jgi:hypothetical protein
VAVPNVFAHDPLSTRITWTREISRLIYRRCAGCHRDVGTSFALTTYEQVKPWAKAIRQETLERRMPPFGAVKGFGDLRDDQALTQQELDLISAWVEGGAPEGDPALLPRTVEFGPAKPFEPRHNAELVVGARTVLDRNLVLEGIKPDKLAPEASVKVIAVKPDHTVVPLIWLYQFRPELARSYSYKQPILLPAGTRIVMELRSAVTMILIADRERGRAH